MQPRIIRALGEQLVELGQRLIIASERQQDRAIVHQGVRRSRLRFQGGRHQAQSFRKISLLVFDEAGQVQCRKMRRFGCQDSTVYVSGCVELTGLMQA